MTAADLDAALAAATSNRRQCTCRAKETRVDHVTRIQTESGSHIEPPLDENWGDLEKLRWHLAVALHDAKLPQDIASVEPGNLTINGRRVTDAYDIRWRSPAGRTGGSWSAGGFHHAWGLINGISLGFSIAHGEAGR